MNERISELAEQAQLTSITTKGMEDIVDGCYIVSPDKLKEFAELIVRECLNNMENCDGDLNFAIWTTKKDFGVE